MTDILYIQMAKENKTNLAIEKLERDFRDLSPFPKIKKKLTKTYKSRKKLLKNYPQIK